MASLKFYNDMISQPVRAIWIFMKMNNIPFEDVKVQILNGENKTEEYLQKFPTGKVPAIDDNGFCMVESVAILRYLCAKYADKISPNWYPVDILKRARVDEFMSWQHTNIRKGGLGYFIAKFLSPVIRKEAVEEAKIQENDGELHNSLDFIEKYFLQENSYIAGDDITLSDLLCICEIMQPVAIRYDVTKGRPKLAAWMERVKSRLGVVFDEAHEVILELGKQM